MVKRVKHQEGCELDMTPMIDVVFQLIIFFIVTLTINKEMNKDIKLEDSVNGIPIEDEEGTLVVEVDRTGRISINNFALSPAKLKQIMRGRYNRMGSFPVMIRADKLARHKHVKRVMDVCTESGIWRINFVAILEHKAQS